MATRSRTRNQKKIICCTIAIAADKYRSYGTIFFFFFGVCACTDAAVLLVIAFSTLLICRYNSHSSGKAHCFGFVCARIKSVFLFLCHFISTYCCCSIFVISFFISVLLFCLCVSSAIHFRALLNKTTFSNGKQ